MNYYFPSCMTQKEFPLLTKKVNDYIKNQATIMGCCRTGHTALKEDDTAIVICPNCARIIEESSDCNHIKYIWEIIDEDPNFVFPDYKQTKITLQKCWTGKEDVDNFNAVYSLLKKMNFDVCVKDDVDFCDTKLVRPKNKSNVQLAPRKYSDDVFIEVNDEVEYFSQYASSINTDKVATICLFCKNGLLLGQKDAYHIIELLFKGE